MIEAYQLPHECEREGLTETLSQLSARQRRVLRAYVWQVELGERTVTEWLESEACPVARSQWYNGGPAGKYWGNPDFQRALAAYKRAGLEWQTNQERRAVEAAQRRIRRAAPGAADRLVDQVGNDIGVFFKISERWTSEPLPSQEIIDERWGEDEKGNPVREYLVRVVVLDLDKLRDPQYSRWVREFGDSPKSGVTIKLYDAQRAAESILDRADVETATKAETHVEGQIGLDPAAVDRLDQALMAAMYGRQANDRADGERGPDGMDGD